MWLACSRSIRTGGTARHAAQRVGGLAGGWAGRPTWRRGRRCRGACGGRRCTGRLALACARVALPWRRVVCVAGCVGAGAGANNGQGQQPVSAPRPRCQQPRTSRTTALRRLPPPLPPPHSRRQHRPTLANAHARPNTQTHGGRTHPYGTCSRVEHDPGNGHVKPVITARKGTHRVVACCCKVAGGLVPAVGKAVRLPALPFQPVWWPPRRRCGWGSRVWVVRATLLASRPTVAMRVCTGPCRVAVGGPASAPHRCHKAPRPRSTHAPRTLTWRHGCRRTTPASTGLPRLPARRR